NYDTSESKLRREFEVYGAVKKISLINDRNTGKPRGYAFIEYEHERDMHYGLFARVAGGRRSLQSLSVWVAGGVLATGPSLPPYSTTTTSTTTSTSLKHSTTTTTNHTIHSYVVLTPLGLDLSIGLYVRGFVLLAAVRPKLSLCRDAHTVALTLILIPVHTMIHFRKEGRGVCWRVL
ncbi:hypothetical protein EGW08_010228, partial [Elysia chlorotica]